jgi:hypothetical protein
MIEGEEQYGVELWNTSTYEALENLYTDVHINSAWESIRENNKISTKESLCKIWGFHGGDYEEWCLLGCYAMWLL